MLAQVREGILIATDQLRSNKLRSALTILGVVIGVTTVMAMSSIVTGIQTQVFNAIATAGNGVARSATTGIVAVCGRQLVVGVRVEAREQRLQSRVRDFEEWIRARRVVPVIQDLRTRADALRPRELERALKQLARGEAPEVVVEHLSQALTNKFLHDPMSTLREAGDDAAHARLQALLARFYSHSDD